MRRESQSANGRVCDPSELASEHLLPLQFTELLQRPSERTPELRLIAAVLEGAIRSFCQCAGSRGVRSQQLFQETAEWFASHDVTWPFAFENICDALAIEPDWVRRLLARWRSNQQAAGGPAAIPSIRLRVTGSRHAVSAGAPGLSHLTALAPLLRCAVGKR
jgi:hypothetical protein